MSTPSHLLSDAAFGPVTHSEIYYAQQLVSSAPEHSLTLFDRGFMSAELLVSSQGSGRHTHWLTPIKSKTRYQIIESFSEHDHLVEMPVSPQAKQQVLIWEIAGKLALSLFPLPKGISKGLSLRAYAPILIPVDALLNVYWQRNTRLSL
ncbi:MAG: hypothetical protein LPH19_03295 [Shewanella sp.]|nr:hypothetical protein [Shewanella sp.]MCF1430934.1 hypothetical protein [Shewanella sp.]